MINDGLINEVQDLLKKYDNFPTAFQGLGYKEVKEYLDGKITKEEMIEKIKQESRRYAKRQLTWFRRDDRIKWFNRDEFNTETELNKAILNYIKTKIMFHFNFFRNVLMENYVINSYFLE